MNRFFITLLFLTALTGCAAPRQAPTNYTAKVASYVVASPEGSADKKKATVVPVLNPATPPAIPHVCSCPEPLSPVVQTCPESEPEPEVVKVLPPEKPGSTLIMGDSSVAGLKAPWIMKNLPSRLDIDGKVKLLAIGGRPSNWLLSELRFKAAYKNGEPFEGIQNAFVVIGANDLGERFDVDKKPFRKGEKVEAIWSRLEEIYTILKPHCRVYAGTIAPAMGNPSGMWAIDFSATEADRVELNRRIFEAAKTGLVHHVVDLAATASNGGLADDNDPRMMDKGFLQWKNDPVHAAPEYIIEILKRELAVGTNKNRTPLKEATEKDQPPSEGPYDGAED